MKESKSMEYYNNLELRQWNTIRNYEIDGLKVVLDLHVSESNEDNIIDIGYFHVPLVLKAIQERIPDDIKRALVEADVTILLTDIESIKIKYQNPEVDGCYDHDNKKLLIGLGGMNPIVYLFHEIGHFIDRFIIETKCFKADKKDVYYSEISGYVSRAFDNESDMFRDYCKKSYSEFVAVAFENYFSGNLHREDSPMTTGVIHIYLYLLAVKYGNVSMINGIKDINKDIEKIISE